MADRAVTLAEQLAEVHHAGRGGWLASLEEALAGLGAREAAWCPAPGQHSIWQNVRHMAFWDAFVLSRLDGEAPTGRPIDNDATFGPAGDPADQDGWQGAVADLRSTCARLQAAVRAMDDPALDRPVNSRGTPAGEMVAGVALHGAYHIGQIVLLRRLQGLWPG